MARFAVLRRVARDRAIVLVLIGVAAVVAWFVLGRTPPRPARLRISAGRPQGRRHAMAEALAASARERRVMLKFVTTAGSEEALDRLQAGELDLALVQGGLEPGSWDGVRQVAALHIEPLHLLVKPEIADAVATSLDALKGRSVNLGERGSGTHALAIEVLRFAGLAPEVDFRSMTLSYEELEAAGTLERLPDAVFMVSLLPSPVARRLATRHGYRLVALPFGEAFALGGDRPEVDPSSGGGGLHPVRHDVVVVTQIPAFTYGVRPAVPLSDLPTLGTRLLLVTRAEVDAEAVSRLLEATFASAFAQIGHPPLAPDLLELPTEFPPHPGARLFQEQRKPLITGDVIDAIEKELSIGGAVLGAAFFLWQWLKSRYRRLRESGFEHSILLVASIEDRALRLELAETLDLPALLALQDELGRAKADAIAKFAAGELEGEDLLSGFLAQASDARDHLTRLILHRRDDLERQARKQKREATALWREALQPADGVPAVPEVPASESDA